MTYVEMSIPEINKQLAMILVQAVKCNKRKNPSWPKQAILTYAYFRWEDTCEKLEVPDNCLALFESMNNVQAIMDAAFEGRDIPEINVYSVDGLRHPEPPYSKKEE